MAYYKYNWLVVHPLYTLKNQGPFFHCSNVDVHHLDASFTNLDFFKNKSGDSPDSKKLYQHRGPISSGMQGLHCRK